MIVIGVFMAGWGCRNKYSLLGAMRTIAQEVSYEIPLVLSIIGVVMLAGSLSMTEIVKAQEVPFIFVQPLGFFIYITAAMAEINRTPFDLLEAESEIIILEQMIRNLKANEVELYSLIEGMRQASGNYLAAIARGQRILGDRTAFRQATAERVSNARYKDMAFRIFRNDALQKYNAQFDLAAKYIYLAAKAYGYETNLLHFDGLSGDAL